MAVTYIVLLSCIVYGTLASPPSSSYLPPSGGASGGRPSGPAPISRPTGGVSVGRPAAQAPSAPVTRLPAPSSSYLPPGRGRPAVSAPTVSGPAVSGPVVSGSTVTTTGARPIPSAGVGLSRPSSAGHQHSSRRAGVPAASGYGPRTVGSHAPY